MRLNQSVYNAQSKMAVMDCPAKPMVFDNEGKETWWRLP